MQGDRVEESVLSALDKINSRSDSFDVVVIIRGGGATSDLSGFDTYLPVSYTHLDVYKRQWYIRAICAKRSCLGIRGVNLKAIQVR